MFNSNVNFYGIMILLALTLNIFVVLKIAKKYTFSKIEIVCLLIYENIGIFIGAKILTYLTHIKELNGNFNILTLGVTSYGAVIGAILSLLIFSKLYKKNFKEILYIFTPGFPLMYAIGKLGCLFAGCCYGIEYNGIGSISYEFSNVAPKGVSLFPIQFVEAIVFFVIFIYIMIKYRKNQINFVTLGKGSILCGTSKFILDFFRMSHIGKIISINQLISIFFITVGILTLYHFHRTNLC